MGEANARLARAAGQVGEDLAEAYGDMASGVSDALVELAETRQKSRRATDLQRANMGAARELQDLHLEVEKSPDWRNNQQRFLDGAQKIRDKWAADLDSVTAPKFQGQFQNIFLPMMAQTNRDNWKKEADEFSAGLDETVTEAARLAGEARTDAERAGHVARGEAAIKAGVDVGFIKPSEAMNKVQALHSGVDEAAVRQEISRDPENAAILLLDNSKFSRLDPIKRQQLLDTAVRRADARSAERARQAAAADRRAEKELKKQGDANLREAWSRHDAGELDHDYVEQIRETVTPAEYKSLLTALDPDAEDVNNDPAAYAEVQGLLLEDPEKAYELALGYHGARQLKDDVLNMVRTKLGEVRAGNQPKPAYVRARSHIATSLKVSELNPAVGAPQRLANALAEIDQWANDNQAADREAYMDKARQIVREYEMVRTEELAVTMPWRDWMVGNRHTFDVKDLAETRTAIIKAREAGELDQAEYETRVREWDKWRRVLEIRTKSLEAAKAAKKRRAAWQSTPRLSISTIRRRSASLTVARTIWPASTLPIARSGNSGRRKTPSIVSRSRNNLTARTRAARTKTG